MEYGLKGMQFLYEIIFFTFYILIKFERLSDMIFRHENCFNNHFV